MTTTTTIHACQPADLSEVRMSICTNGCKVMICAICSLERIVHSAVYGCDMADFEPVEGARRSRASTAGGWTGGCPAETWATWVRNWQRAQQEETR